MSGMWNTVDFERIRKIVRIQKEYPEVVKVANKMGRMADDEGQEQLHVAQGNVYKMEHSSKSDILGITVGNDLNALLPTDWRIVPMMSWKTCLSINMLPENFRPSAINPRSCNRHGDGNKACYAERTDDSLSGHFRKHGSGNRKDCIFAAD